MIFSHQGQSYTAILETQVFRDGMEGVTDTRYFDDLIRQIRDEPSDYVWTLVSQITETQILT